MQVTLNRSKSFPEVPFEIKFIDDAFYDEKNGRYFKLPNGNFKPVSPYDELVVIGIHRSGSDIEYRPYVESK